MTVLTPVYYEMHSRVSIRTGPLRNERRLPVLIIPFYYLFLHYLNGQVYGHHLPVKHIVQYQDANIGSCLSKCELWAVFCQETLDPAILVDISTCITSLRSQCIYMTIQEANDTLTEVKADVRIHHNPCTGIRPWKKNIQVSHCWHTPLKITMITRDSVLLPPSVEEDISLSVELKQRGQRINFEEIPKSNSEQVSFGWIMHLDTKPKWFRNGLTNTSQRCW